jgi:hypothetical protein
MFRAVVEKQCAAGRPQNSAILDEHSDRQEPAVPLTNLFAKATLTSLAKTCG